jgi:hypothetical protein
MGQMLVQEAQVRLRRSLSVLNINANMLEFGCSTALCYFVFGVSLRLLLYYTCSSLIITWITTHFVKRNGCCTSHLYCTVAFPAVFFFWMGGDTL